MAEVVLFHHALGLTPGVAAFADRVRAKGHTIHTPDLFDGNTFDEIAEGMEYVESVGFEGFIRRGSEAADGLGPGLVYAGMSLGVVPAQMLAQTIPGARGAVFLYSCVPTSEFGGAWPKDVPVQIHGMDADQYFVGEGDVEAAREVVSQADDGELFLYPGDQHYFADSTRDSYDKEAADLLIKRVVEFLDRLRDL